jgi:hypothetical protein
MSDESRFKRFRAVLKNAAVWGVSWGALGTAVATLMRLSDNISPVFALLDGIGMGIRIGVVGALAGAAFSTFISLAYRGKGLGDISWKRFGIGGAILAGAFVPAWMQSMNLLTGGNLVPLNLITDDIVLSAVFGGITAAGTMFLAKKDAASHPEIADEALDDLDSRLSAGEGAYRDPTEKVMSPIGKGYKTDR